MSNVKVAVRVRPINKRELERNGKIIVDTNGDTVSVTNIKVDSQAEYGDSREKVKTFTFDYCYDSTGEQQSPQYAPQQQVFQDLGTEILQASFEGYNACVLAYGQTSTGKTYTMTGIQEDPGLIPRICEGLFSHVDDFEANDITFRIHISYLEIYNERVRDLLRPALSHQGEKYTLKVREHPKEGPYVQDLSSHVVNDNEQIQTLLDKGNESRVTASTYMHDHSSRSHAIVTVNFIQAKLEDDLPHEIVSKIHLVDLAGSERADPNWSLNYKGRLKEGSNINKSLVTLGNVIKSLAEKSLLSWSTDNLGSTQSFTSSGGGEGRASPYCSPKRLRLPYIPYRDSVLTWLLKDSLGGNSKTIMIATISPASICYNETISTLRYAQRAKSIVNKPKINEDGSVTLIRELRLEIDRLKHLLAGTQMGFYPHSDVMYVVPFQKSQAEGEALFPENTLEQELELQEDRANKLTQTWMDKWMETHEIIKESDLSIRGLKKKANSMGVLIDSQMPHLIGMDNDILSTGVIIYHLKEGKTLVGREDAKREQDIVLSGPGIQREHCFIKNVNGSVTLYPNRGSKCMVNGIECKGQVLLKQGDSVILGRTQMFRFNNPAEAAVLRERRESQESLLDDSSQQYEYEESDYSRHRVMQNNRMQSLQLESQYQTESEKIERAKQELEQLKEEHLRAEEQRQLKEEELWKTHNTHIQEIQEEKIRLAKLKEETVVQRHKAEQDLQYARECLEKEREAFYQQIQEELHRVRDSKNKDKEVQEVFTEDTDSSEVVTDVIRRRKLSVEGQLKSIVQKEILRTFSHRETERLLRKQTDDFEDEFELSKQQIESQLGKIREIEEQYRHTDAEHYTEINKTDEKLDGIKQREEQLELYLEEKEDLFKLQSDKPRPLRTACSAEVLTNLKIETEFSQKTSSMLALNHGSVGDLPAISHQFSLSSMMSVDSQSMDDVLYNRHDDTNDKSKYKKKISSEAKNVTDRLYQKSTPKFKYEPKHKKTASPTIDNKTRGRKGVRSDQNSSHRSHDSSGSPSHKNTLPEKKRKISPSDRNISDATSATHSAENQTVENSLSKRHVKSSTSLAKSSTSLASVPEAVGEEGDDQIMHSSPDISQVVRRRKGGNRRIFDDEFRRHSEPMGEKLADAFEKYSQEMEKSNCDNLNYKHSKSQDDAVLFDSTVSIPEVIVSEFTDSEQSLLTFHNNRTHSSQGQECEDMAINDGQESLVSMEDIEGQLQCGVSMEDNVGGMECNEDTVSQGPSVLITSDVNYTQNTDITDDNTSIDDGMCRSANFNIDLMPIIDVSYSEGEVPEPYIFESVVSCQNTPCEKDTPEKDEMIQISRKRELKPHSGTSASPSKLRKGDQNNYEWLVNAITNLSKEKLLVSGEDNESDTELMDNNTEDFSYGNNVDENQDNLSEHYTDQSFDDLNTTGGIPVVDNVSQQSIIEQNDNSYPTVSTTEQEFLDNEQNRAYYSDSLDEADSLDGSRPVRYHDEEVMTDSIESTNGENNDNVDENEVKNGVIDYFSDVDPDLVNEFNDEEMVQEISDYDELGEEDVNDDRTEIFIKYPTDFPGSLLYSIQEESVPASPDQSDSKDISSDLSCADDRTLDGFDDNYLSQVVILGQEEQALIMKTEEATDICETDNYMIVNSPPCEQGNREQYQSIKSDSQQSDMSNDQHVRSETQIVLTAEMDKVEESPIVYHHIGTVNDRSSQDNIDLDLSLKESNSNEGDVTDELVGMTYSEFDTGTSSIQRNFAELISASIENETSIDFESKNEEPNTEAYAEKLDKFSVVDGDEIKTENVETQKNAITISDDIVSKSDMATEMSSETGNLEQDNEVYIPDRYSEQLDKTDMSETAVKTNPENEKLELAPEEMSQYLSNIAQSIHQAINVKSDSDNMFDTSDDTSKKESDTSRIRLASEQVEKNISKPVEQSSEKYEVDSDGKQYSQVKTEINSPEDIDMDISFPVRGDNTLLCSTTVKDDTDKTESLDVIKKVKVKKIKSKPETRTLGVSTSPDLVNVSCGDDIASDDSLQEVQEELQVLQDALDNKSPKNSSTNGSSISSARKATRKRAMEKRGTGVCTESEDLMSDASPESQGKSSSSRPDSASRRRKRPNTKSTDRRKSKGLSSDENITSENDSIYSDESPSRNQANEKNQEEIPIEIAQTLQDSIDELTDSILQNDHTEVNNMDRNIPNGYCEGDSKQDVFDTKEKSHHINGNYIPNLQLSGVRDYGSNEQSVGQSSNDSQISWRSYDSSEGRTSRSASETRDASQQTDNSFVLPLRSPMSTQTVSGIQSLSVSPVSVWNSVDKIIKSPKGISDGTKSNSPGGKQLLKKKLCKLSDLSYTAPEVWSADTSGLPPATYIESGSESEGDDVVMETETCSPATPSTSDHFFESGCMVLEEPPSGRHVPVKYEVTLKPEETNILYNVEKTEYKTYGLHSPNHDVENITFPESININITDRTSNVVENRLETVTQQRFQVHQTSENSPSGDIVSEITFRASRELSTNCSDSNVEMKSDRSSTEQDEKHFVETTCENHPLDEKLEHGLSPRESDTTSDYGTMIFDRRRGVSTAYDSDDIDSLASYGKYFPESHENTPRGLKMNTEDQFIEANEQESVQPRVQNSDTENNTNNLESQKEIDSVEYMVNEEEVLENSLRPINVPISQGARKSIDSKVNHDHSRSSEDVYLSAQMSRTSSESSDYRTPQQSPRDHYHDISCDNIEIPDISDKSGKSMLKTVSVNTELQEDENIQSREQIIRETLKNELQKKIDDLKHNRKSKDDSAISSDFTDGDSVTVSPRGSQLYESDKTLRIGSIRPNTVEVRTTKTDTMFEPSSGAQSYLPKLVDIDNKSVQKIPLKDSGNVFDNEDMEDPISETTHYLEDVPHQKDGTENVRKKKEHHTSASIENEMFEEQENSDRSLSPGEIISDDMYEQFASGLNSGGEIDIETESYTRNITNDKDGGQNQYSTSGVETLDELSDDMKSSELIEMLDSNKLMKEKSPSLSNLEKEKDVQDYRRSVSENCIDQYEENATLNSSSSNDSIVFVFMGQSHTRESMEELKNYTSKQKEYKVHESDDDILSQNHGDKDSISYKDSNDSLDSHEAMMANMENILNNDNDESPEISKEVATDSREISEEIGLDSQDISQEIGLDSQDISEEIGLDSQDISEEIGLDSQDISEENYIDSQDISDDINSSGDNLDQDDFVFSGEASPLYNEVTEEMVKQEVNRTEAGLIHNALQQQYDEDEEPLRHKFGIDESILPLPTRSVSSDNLPRKISNQKIIHRSRSTSLLDVETVDKNTASDNEGIFPPNVHHSENNSSEIEQFEPEEQTETIEVEYEVENIESPQAPPTPAPSVVDEADDDKQPSHAINREVLYSSLFPLQTQQSQLDHNGNVEDDNAISQFTGSDTRQASSRFISVGVQASLADSETQTEPLFISPDCQIFPSLDSSLRAQSLATLQSRMTQYNPSEGSENWYNLSSLMLETIPLLKTINERLPGADISLASSTENVIINESTTLATQTTGSLEDLNSTAVQTDQGDGNREPDTEKDVAASATQTELQELDVSFTQTYDFIRDESLNRTEISVQTDTPEVRVTETSDICLQTDFVWSMAGQQPTTTTTTSRSIFSVERPNESENMPIDTTEPIDAIVTTEIVNLESKMKPSDSDVNLERQDSIEDQYTDTIELFYDFVNKCYVERVVASDHKQIIRRHETASEQDTAEDENKFEISKTLYSTENEPLKAQNLNLQYQSDINEIVSTSTQPTSYNSRIEEIDLDKFNSGKNNEVTVEKLSTDQTKTTSASEQNIGSAFFTERNESPVEEITEIITFEIPVDNVVEESSTSKTVISEEYKPWSYTQKSMDIEKSSKKISASNDDKNISEELASPYSLHTERKYQEEKFIDDEIISDTNTESLREKIIEEIVTFEIPVDNVVEESSTSKTVISEEYKPWSYTQKSMDIEKSSNKISASNDDKNISEELVSPYSLHTERKYHEEKFIDNEIISDTNTESPREEIIEEIVTFEIPINMQEPSVSETFSSEHQPRSYTLKNMDSDITFHKNTAPQGRETFKELFSHQSKPRSYKERHIDNEMSIDRYTESPEEEITEETVTFKIPVDDVQEPSLSKWFMSERKSHVEQYLEDENIVEDIVSPRRDDTGDLQFKSYSSTRDDMPHTFSKDYIKPNQAGMRQNTNTTTSASSQQSSQSDGSQQTSESGQSEHHSFETKTIKRTRLPDKGDEDSDDDENKDGDEVFKEQTSEHHRSKHDSTQVQTILTEREHVMETEFYVPDIEASQAEMDALKEEHDKTMDAIKKASAERKQRTKELRNKTKKVIATEFEMTKEVENWNDEEAEKRNNDNKQVTFDMNAVETREYSIISEDSEPQRDDNMAEKTSEIDYITETVHEKPSVEESERKLQELEEKWKEYVRIEQELKKQDEKEKNDLIDDVLSDSDDVSDNKLNKSSNEPAARPNFRKYKVQTKIETEEPISPITKTDKADIKFMPTYSEDYKRDRPVNNEETIIKESFTKVRSELPSKDRKPAYPISDFRPVVTTSDEKQVVTETKQTVDKSDKIPTIVMLEKKPVMALPRSVSVDTYSRNKGLMRSTGVEVSVDSSDDFTQTDDLPVNEPAEYSQHNDLNSNQIKSELDRLHNERVEIIEMMALNYLPASLTVELLEAKLNYCIGQTDLLMDSLEDTWDITETTNIQEYKNTHLTKEYLTKYREDLRKSKKDIKICKERMDLKSGKGRGRPWGRNRDMCRLRRKTEIEAFKAERNMEQQNFNTVKTLHRLNPAVEQTERKTRSASPGIKNNIRHYTMTPSEHAAYLIKLRKQVVKATEQEELRHRISRSCSPYVGNRFDTENSPPTSPRSYSVYSSERLYVTPGITVSVTEPTGNEMRPYTMAPRSLASPRSYSADTSYYSTVYEDSYSTMSSRHHQSVERSGPRYHSAERSGFHQTASPQLNRSLSPQYRTMSPNYNRNTSPNYNLSHHGSPQNLSLEQESFSESVYSVNESQQLLREIQEARQHNQREISRAEESLQSFNRYGSSMDSHRPYSNYTNSSSDLLDTTYLSGSYELYDEPMSTTTMSRSSSCRSLDHDSDSVHSSFTSPRYEHNVLRTRPVHSSDIKSRIRRKMPRT